MKKFIMIIAVILLAIVLVLGMKVGKIFLPTSGKPDAAINIKIERGASPVAIADTLKRNGLINKKEDFLLAVRLFRQHQSLKAGFYQLRQGLSPYQLMKILAQGKTARIRVTFPEGYTSFQMASLLQARLGIDSTKFMHLVHDRDFLKKLHIDSESLEGYLYPETYYFDWGMSERDVMRIMVAELRKNLSDSLMKEIKDSGWTLHQILTLASLIEGEAMVDSERAIISAVYQNRLQKNMLLQADPTIQFIIPDGPRRLLNKDLQIDSPYNTYKYPGLPPGPVNNPGIKSIIAAVHPADVDYLYFVARGDGAHIFSKNLKEHLKAKRKFDEYRRLVKRKERLNGK
ncbi:MAG: endolytic transglycosylase MltG [Calditrichaeota bacterium]|nr:endolytic transglycosylase MltG [Calditrichota bacterium]